MKKRLIAVFLLLVVVVVLWPFSAWAAEQEGSGWGWLETLGRWLNLTILFGGIFYFLREPAARFFAQRRAAIQEEISRAGQMQREAEGQLTEIKGRMDHLEEELEAIRQESDQESERERRLILDQAARDVEKVMGQAQRQIDGIGRAVRKDLKSYAAELAIDLAEGKIRKDLGKARDEALESQFLAALSKQTRKKG